MARRMKWKWNKKPNLMRIITGIVMLLIFGLVGTLMLNALGETYNCTETPFVDGFNLLGFDSDIVLAKGNTTDYGTYNCSAATSGVLVGDEVLVGGGPNSTGILGVLFIIAAAGVIISAFGTLRLS